VSNPGMFLEIRREATAKIGASFLLFCTFASIACVFLTLPQDFGPIEIDVDHLTQIAAMASSLVFLLAGVRVFYDPRSGYVLGLLGGFLALPWFVRLELSFGYRFTNSWIALNLPDGGYRGANDFLVFAKCKIVAVALTIIVVISSALHLLPASWTFRNSPIRERTWPAFATCFLALAIWYGTSVTPYRIPYIVDAVWPELEILHVEKHGIQFREVGISAARNSEFYIWRNNRRWFQYRFGTSTGRGTIPNDIRPRMPAVLQSLQLRSFQTLTATALRSWNDEGWYVLMGRSRVYAFTKGTPPPREVAELFYEIENLPATESWQGDLKDVCLGFCYDPLAGLGFMFVNDRCHTDAHETHCE
jgi:hypothetical protein